MSELQQLQQAMKGYILTHEEQIVPQIAKPPRDEVSTRLNIYANAYFIRLKEVLAIDYPVIEMRLGEDQFDKLCRDYLTAYPSHHFSVGVLGQYMAEFLATHKPYKDKFYLSELAQFEWAIQAVLERPDAPVLSLQDLQTVQAEDWPNLIFSIHPSVLRLHLQTNAFDLWRGVKENDPPQIKRPKQTPQKVFVWRKETMSYYCAATEAEDWMLEHTMAGDDFSAVCEGLCEFMDEEEVAVFAVGLLQRWFNGGMVSQIRV